MDEELESLANELKELNVNVWDSICNETPGFAVYKKTITGKWRHGTEESVITESQETRRMFQCDFLDSCKDMDFSDMNGDTVKFYEIGKETKIVPKAEITEQTNLLETARKVNIIDAVSCQEGTEVALTAKRLRLKIEKYHKPHIDNAHKAHKDLVKAMKELTEPLKKAEEWIKGQIVIYNREIERVRLEAAEKAQREAEEKLRAEKERLEAEALAAAEKGDEEAFTQAEQEREEVTKEDFTPVQAPVEKMPTGVSARKNWQVEITDLPALIKAVIETKAPESFVIANEKVIKHWAKAVGDTQKIPGVRVYDKGTVTLRT